MKKGLLISLIIISITYLSVMYFLGKNSKNNVLGIEEYESPIPIATEPSSPTDLTPSTSSEPSSLTALPSATPAKTPTPQPTTTPVASSEVNSFIERFAAQYGVDANVLRYIAVCESGFKSNAESAGYMGLYQFGAITWKNLRTEFGEDTNPDLRYSAEESVQTAAYALSKGKSGIWPNCVP